MTDVNIVICPNCRQAFDEGVDAIIILHIEEFGMCFDCFEVEGPFTERPLTPEEIKANETFFNEIFEKSSELFEKS